jgi:multiple sugar transport system substrate-binding protein
VKAYGGKWDTQEDDIIPAYRYILQETGQEEMFNEGKKMCGIAFDGDNMLMYYRKDLMTDEEKDNFKSQFGYDLRAPETWDEFRDVSEFYTRKKGETLAGERLDDDFYGNAQLCDKFQNNTWFLSRFGSGMGQGPPQPLYWDENMEPAFNGEIGQLALEDWVESVKTKYAIPGTTSFDYMAQRAAGLGGEVFMWISWGADGKGAQDPVHSRVVGKLGFGHVPGSWSKDKSEIIYAPVIQFNRAFLINKNAVNAEAAFHAARILTDPDHCLIYNWAPWSATEPVRYSAFEDPEKVSGILRRAGYEFPLEDLKQFMEAIKWAIEKGYPDYPYIEGTTEYQNSLNYHTQQAVLGEETVKEALDNAADEWRTITEKVGPEKQKGNWLRTQEIYKKAGLKL